MARKLRRPEQANWYHVYNRGADRQDIFSLDGDREFFETLIGHACGATGVEVHAYALMTNHFHFLVFAPEASLPAFMQTLCGRYALAYNTRTSRSGPLFTGRYGAVPIMDDSHLLIEARYVERNPLAIVPSTALATYRYSSLGVLLGRRDGPDWLRTEMLLPLISRSEYLNFVTEEHPTDRSAPIGLPSTRRPSVAALRRATSSIAGLDFTAKSGPVRNVALAIAFELRLADSLELSRLLGISASAVRMAARRGRILIDTDDSMARTKLRIVSALRARPLLTGDQAV